MLRHAGRAVPWALVAVAAVLVVGLLGLVRWRPWTLWPLEGVAVGLLAAAAGWCLDEPAAAVVDVAPRGLAWRTATRAPGIGVLVLAWAGGVRWAGDALFGHPLDVLQQGGAGVLVAMAWTTWRRAAGESSPGGRWALTVVPLAAGWALVRPWPDAVPVFPFGPDAGWRASAVGWSAATGLAGAALAVVLTLDGVPELGQRRPGSPRRTGPSAC
ncbi:MAG: hypothetical protein FWF90_07670 [Promicromonosporaceae bacterium]|nr:hypothetical protein [Promicromonosporaceae bacterium]